MNDQVAFYRDKVAKQREENSAFEATVADRSVARASTGTIGDESIAGFMEGMAQSNPFTKDEHTQIIDGFAEMGKNIVIGPPAAFAGGTADLVGLSTLLLYNGLKKARGESTDWPEDFNDVPATSDYYGAMLGADTHSLAFIAPGFLVNPASIGKVKKFVSTALKEAKVLQGSGKARIMRREAAEQMLSDGAPRAEIWKKTGFFPDSNGVLRFAISDADANMKWDSINALATKQNPDPKLHDLVWVEARADEIIDHPAMFELFPTAAGTKIKMQMRVAKKGDGTIVYRPSQGEESAKGSFRPSDSSIKISHTDPLDALIHELQHNIDTISNIGSGANAKVIADSAYNFRYARIMKNIAKGREEVATLSDKQWREVLQKAGIAEDKLDEAVQQARWIAGMDETSTENMIRYMSEQESKFANETGRWLNEIQFQHGEKAVEDAMLKLDTKDIEDLAFSRYISDQEEVTARISQALKNVPQNALDDLPADPYDLQQWLTPQVAGKMSREGFGEVRPMMYPKNLDEIVGNKPPNYVDLSGNKLEPLQPYKVDPKFKSLEQRDVYLKPKFLLLPGDDKIRVEYLYDPTPSELKRWAAKKFKDAPDDYKNLRYIEDTEGHLHVWDANDALHEDFGKALNIKPNMLDELSVEEMVESLSTLEEGVYLGPDLHKIRTR